MLDGKLALATLLVFGAACSPAIAQESRRLDFGVRMAGRYDSNVARSTQVLAASRDITQKDYIFAPAATFDLVLPVSRQSFFLKGSAGYDFYRKNDQLNSERFDLQSGLNARFGSCTGGLLGGYQRSRSDIQDLTAVDPENIFQLTQVTLQAGCARDAGLGISGSVGHDWATNSGSTQRQADYETNRASVEIGYSRPAFGALATFVQYQKTEYDYSLPLTGFSNGYELLVGGVSFERRIGSRLRGRVEISQSKVDPLSSLPGARKDVDGLTYAGDLTYSPTDRLEVNLEYSRSVVPSTQIGKLYDLEEAYRISGKYRLGSRLDATLGGERREATADAGQTLPVIPIGYFTVSKLDVIFGSLVFRQNDKLSYLLDVSREERTTNDPQFDYSATRVGFTVDVAF